MSSCLWLTASPLVINKAVTESMALVCIMLFLPHFLPVAVIGEEGIGIGWCVVNLGKTKAVGQGQSLTIDAGTANDKDFLVRPTSHKGSLKRRKDFGSRELNPGAREYDVATIGQGSFRQGLESATPHDDSMTRGERLESLQIVGQPVKEFVIEPYGTVLRHGSYQANHSRHK